MRKESLFLLVVLALVMFTTPSFADSVDEATDAMQDGKDMMDQAQDKMDRYMHFMVPKKLFRI